MHVEIEDIVEAGDRVVVTFRQRFKGKGSEIEVKVKSFNVFTVRDTRIVRMALFTGRDAALDAARVESSKVEIVRETFDAYAREDFDSLVALLHPEVELHEWPEGPDSRVYHGPDGIMHARRSGPRRGSTSAPSRSTSWRPVTVSSFLSTAQAKEGEARSRWSSRRSASTRSATPKVAKVQYFTDREAALAAAGLSDRPTRQEARR
jgi:ketosteroid isomerase-like protein